VLPRDDLYAKNISTIAEIRARGGPTYVVTQPGPPLPTGVEGVIEVPKSEPELDALLLNIPLQLLAYHVALAKGRDIDQPRNLAKSVTVE
jgi:glucosamine--fructose-6-phosphate aminotransferase (isomerizing)